VAVVGVELVGERYWAVTVATGPVTDPRFWRVGVLASKGRLVAAGMPAPVAGPAARERAVMSVTMSPPPVDAPEVQTVAGFAAAYMCGQGELGRYLAPGLEVGTVSPAVCSAVRVQRWGSRELGAGRLEGVAELVLDPGPSARLVTTAVVLARRDGRWEIAEVLPAPPLALNGKEKP
jgi:hypothetical protein